MLCTEQIGAVHVSGICLSQTIYDIILMGNILKSPGYGVDSIGAGILGGIAIGISARVQGLAAAGASNALSRLRKLTYGARRH